jgi:hypothetical protein
MFKKEDKRMQNLESVKISIKEYEKFTSRELTNDENELFSYAYGRGFVDSGKLITDLLTKQ